MTSPLEPFHIADRLHARDDRQVAAIFDTLAASGLQMDETIVHGSAVLALDGSHIKPNDVDAVVSPRLFHELYRRQSVGDTTVTVKYGYHPEVLHVRSTRAPLAMDVSTYWGEDGDKQFAEKLAGTVEIRGIHCEDPATIKEDKRHSLRPKDKWALMKSAAENILNRIIE